MPSWVEQIPSISCWGFDTPLRVATDCSGLGCAEVRLQTIANVRGLRIHNVFSCGIWSGSQKWLQSLGMNVILNDMNMRIWKD